MPYTRKIRDGCRGLCLQSESNIHRYCSFFFYNYTSPINHCADIIITYSLSAIFLLALRAILFSMKNTFRILFYHLSIIAAKEGIWIMDSSDDYSDSIISLTLADLQNEDNFYKVFNIIGNGKI